MYAQMRRFEDFSCQLVISLPQPRQYTGVVGTVLAISVQCKIE